MRIVRREYKAEAGAVDGILDGIGKAGDLFGHAGGRQKRIVIGFHIKPHTGIFHACISETLLQILRTLPCCHNACRFIGRTHIDSFQPHLHHIILLRRERNISILIHDHPLIENQSGLVLGNDGCVGNARHGKLTVGLLH